MTRFRAIAIAFVALALSAGAAFAFTALPDAASTGIETASEMSGKTLPARPVELPTTLDPQVDIAADLPDAAGHGVDVSTVATSDDPTPDSNRGTDVSATARDNHGQATAAEHVPADAGPPAGAGKPEGAGQPADPGRPDEPGAPEGAGKPDGVPAP